MPQRRWIQASPKGMASSSRSPRSARVTRLMRSRVACRRRASRHSFPRQARVVLACSASASASTQTEARPRPSPDGLKRKNSSSPGSRADLSPPCSFRRAARSQFSALRSSRVCLGCAGPIAVCVEWLARTARAAAWAPARRAFGLGLVTGLGATSSALCTGRQRAGGFGGVPVPLAVLAMLLLALYLALFPAFTALIMARLMPAPGGGRCSGAGAWVATEYLRGYLFGGFPWVPLGNSQVTVLPVAQLASVVAYTASPRSWHSSMRARVSCCDRVATSRLVRRSGCAAVVIVAAVGRHGGLPTARCAREGRPSASVSSRATSRRKTNGTRPEARRIFTTYIAMTRDAVRRGAEFVIWPESSTPFMFEEDEAGEAIVRDLAREVRVPILLRQRSDRSRGSAIRHVQRGVPAYTGRADGRRLPQDSPRPVWRVHPVQGLAVLRLAARRAPGGLRARGRRW